MGEWFKGPPLGGFHVKLNLDIPLSQFHMKPLDYRQPATRLLERVEDKPAEQLRVEISAFGRHAFAMLADGPDVVDRGRHN